MARKVDMERVKKTLSIISSLVVGGKLSSPVKALVARGAGCPASVSKYMAILEKQGYILIGHGCICLLSSDAAVLDASSGGIASPQGVAEVPAVAPPSIAGALAPVAVPTTREPGAVVLIDLENAMRGFGDMHRRKLSFQKLFEVLANEFNPVYRWEVFAPPYIAADPKIVQLLREAGFTHVCLCFKGHKDKDQVDSVMMESGRYHARESTAGTIVIVSEDADFAPLASYAKSLGKAAKTYAVSDHPELALEAPVQNAESALYDERALATVLQLYLASPSSPVLATEEPRLNFLKRVAAAVYAVEARDGNNWHAITHRNFGTLARRVQELLPAMAERHIKTALGVLKDAEVLCCKVTPAGHKYYELTSTPALRKAVGVAVK